MGRYKQHHTCQACCQGRPETATAVATSASATAAAVGLATGDPRVPKAPAVVSRRSSSITTITAVGRNSSSSSQSRTGRVCGSESYVWPALQGAAGPAGSGRRAQWQRSEEERPHSELAPVSPRQCQLHIA